MGVTWRGLRLAAAEGLVCAQVGEGSGDLPGDNLTRTATMRRELNLSQAIKPRVRLWVRAGALPANLVKLTASLGSQNLTVPTSATWQELDLDLAAWAGNQGQFNLQADMANPGPAAAAGPAVDDLRFYDAGKP